MDKITRDHFADSQMEAFLRKTRTSALHQKYLPESFSGSLALQLTDPLKDIWGEGATSKLPFGMHTSNPQTHEGEVFHLHSRLSKGFCDPCLGHDTIWRPGQGDEGICRQRKYVDK